MATLNKATAIGEWHGHFYELDGAVLSRNIMWFLAKTLAVLTQKERYFPEIKWSSKSWTHNVFRFYEMIFGREYGIRKENATVIENGRVTERYFYTLESKIAFVETKIREYLKVFEPSPYPYLRPLLRGAIAFDAAASKDTTVDPDSNTHTCTGSDRLLWCGVGWETTQTITSITYNSAALTSGVSVVHSGTMVRAANYYKVNPSTGSNTLSIDYSAAPNGRLTAVSYTGCKQTGVPDATNTDEETSETTFQQTISPVASGCWAIVSWSTSRVTTYDTGTTRGSNSQQGTGDTNGTITSPHTITLTVGAGSIGVLAAATFAPTDSARVSTLLLLGVG